MSLSYHVLKGLLFLLSIFGTNFDRFWPCLRWLHKKDQFFIFISSRNCGLDLLWLHLHLRASSVFKARSPFIFRTWASFTSDLWASLSFCGYLQASTSFFQDLWESFQALVGYLSPNGLNLISNHNNLIRAQWCLCLL